MREVSSRVYYLRCRTLPTANPTCVAERDLALWLPEPNTEPGATMSRSVLSLGYRSALIRSTYGHLQSLAYSAGESSESPVSRPKVPQVVVETPISGTTIGWAVGRSL